MSRSESSQIPTAYCLPSNCSSDADSDVLAEYVLALIRSEESDEEVRNNCVENLKDFLREGIRPS
jgi:hypothetical protein